MRVILAAIAVLAGISAASADTYVNGYTRQDGTYVAPHYRSSPDSSRLNNWSSQGNTNPHTGQQGTQNPYQPQQPYYGSSNNLNGRRW
jgi:hypothetical protein